MKAKTLRCLAGVATLMIGALAVAWLSSTHEPVQAQEPKWDTLASAYKSDVQPLLVQYCQRCHSGKHPEADIDLKHFASLAEVRKAPRVWQKVLEMLETGQMPPRDAKQFSDEQRTKVQAWVRSYLKLEARALAGDPGPVTLRRLSNNEYTFTLRDLTGVPTLEPAREFPVDGAAGEGFTNTGDALAMSPSLFSKYLDAGKRVAKHAVLLPDGIRFSASTTRQDWTNEILADIRALYSAYSDSTASTQVKLQGLVWDTKQGGRLPVEKYLQATLAEREALRSGAKSIDAVARECGLSAKYLGAVWQNLNGGEPSVLLDEVRARWRQAKPDDAGALAVDISRWQNALWKFNSVGHIGKIGGPKNWMTPADPLVVKQDLRVKLPPAQDGVITFYLAATGDTHVVWQQPRFIAANRPDIALKDVRVTASNLAALRAEIFADTDKYLQAADEASASAKPDLPALAKKHAVDAVVLAAWLDYLGLGSGPAKLRGHFTTKLPASKAYPFIAGWGTSETPLVVANSSDTAVRIPGKMAPHSVAVHPSPKLNAIVGWQSPVAGKARITSKIAHAHPECGDGVSFTIELRRGGTRQRLATGIAQGAKEPKIAPLDIDIKEGDVIAVVVGPRSNHSCDLTAVDLSLTVGAKTWDLAKDVSSDLVASNPHADRLGNKSVWHFTTEPTAGTSESGFVVPAGSVLDQWRSAADKTDKAKLATATAKLLTSGRSERDADASLIRQLASLNGPLLSKARSAKPRKPAAPTGSSWGIDPALFGRHPSDGGAVDAASLCVKSPSVFEVRVPADLVAGYDFATTVALHADSRETAQMQVLTSKPGATAALQPGVPILVAAGSPASKRIATALEAFRELFPPAVCYTKIVPVDEVVTLNLFFREDHHLARLMLDDTQKRKLDRLWDELEYVSHSPVKQVDALNQLIEYATQDSDPRPFRPLQKPFGERAAAFKKSLVDTEPKHLDAVIAFAAKAYRRPLAAKEKDDLASLYQKLRKQEMSHDDAIRLTLARVLVAPAFLYRLESPGPASNAVPVTDQELANRLSYFLWSSAPDAALTDVATANKLHEPDMLATEMKRMLKDARVRRLATEFGCQWLHIRNFD
ncbi:MAG TPA: DUF1592 domain-containing protein, partial [Gemmataceae bacterium]|nr:DUF1592 domain-containing protein [Gemmataceae bacterium]